MQFDPKKQAAKSLNIKSYTIEISETKVKKRYQIFVSSTYEDLRLERQAVMNALLELDCIPSGMELFPAADNDQWSLIKQVIDDCDYYIAIIGGRYGSVGPDGIGYTEMEYRYAESKGKPIIAFLHENPGKISAEKTDQDDKKRDLLHNFRALAEKKMCKYWTNPDNLQSQIIVSLNKLFRTHPSIGWVRADQLPDEDANSEILSLRRKIDELESELESVRKIPLEDTKELAQGNDLFSIRFLFIANSDKLSSKTYEYQFRASWNELFSCVAPLLIDESAENIVKDRLNFLIAKKNKTILKKMTQFESYLTFSDFQINQEDFETIKLQLIALNLIMKSPKSHSITDKNQYLSLATYGKNLLIKLRAIRRSELEDKINMENTEPVLVSTNLEQDYSQEYPDYDVKQTGKFDVDMILMGQPRSKTNKLTRVYDRLKELFEENKWKALEKQNVIQTIELDMNLEKSFVKNAIEEAINEGTLYEPYPDYIKFTSKQDQ